MRRIALVLPLILAFAALAFAAGPSKADANDVAAGKALYLAKCKSCHGEDGSKSLMSKPVKGMKADAVADAMKGYKAKTYGGAKKATMENLAANLSDADIKAVAAYIGTL